MKQVSRPKQVVFILLPFLVVSAFFPFAAWVVVVKGTLGIALSTGYTAALVGKAGGIDPGAVLVTLIYFVLSALVVAILVKLRYRFLAWSIGVSSVVLLIFIFSTVSSLIWF